METQVIKIEAEPTREDANIVIAQRSATVRASVQEKLAEYGMPQPVCDLRYGLLPLRAENPYRDVINAANYIHLALMDSWFFFFEAERLRRELAELKGRKVEDVKCTVIR